MTCRSIDIGRAAQNNHMVKSSVATCLKPQFVSLNPGYRWTSLHCSHWTLLFKIWIGVIVRVWRQCGPSTLLRQFLVGAAVQESDEDHRHVVATKPTHLTVRCQASCHQLLTDLKFETITNFKISFWSLYIEYDVTDCIKCTTIHVCCSFLLNLVS